MKKIILFLVISIFVPTSVLANSTCTELTVFIGRLISVNPEKKTVVIRSILPAQHESYLRRFGGTPALLSPDNPLEVKLSYDNKTKIKSEKGENISITDIPIGSEVMFGVCSTYKDKFGDMLKAKDNKLLELIYSP